MAVCKTGIGTLFLGENPPADVMISDIDGGTSVPCTGSRNMVVYPSSLGCSSLFGLHSVSLNVSTRHFELTDTCTREFSVVDEIPPAISGLAATIFLNSTGTADVRVGDVAVATDNCAVSSLIFPDSIDPSTFLVGCSSANSEDPLLVNVRADDLSTNVATEVRSLYYPTMIKYRASHTTTTTAMCFYCPTIQLPTVLLRACYYVL